MTVMLDWRSVTVGQTVWRAFAYVGSGGDPVVRIRPATVTRLVPERGNAPLLTEMDGTAEVFYTTRSDVLCATEADAREHCARVLAEAAGRIEAMADTLRGAGELSPA